MRLFIKNLIFTVFVPGTVAAYIPYRIIKNLHSSLAIHWELLKFISVIFIFVGVAIYFSCLLHFALTGHGTPAPIDAPKRLVIKGLYCYVRNPMYVGVIVVILGWALLYNSFSVFQYAILMWIIFHIVIIFIEEPTLRRQFGEPYKSYCSKVRRWIPGKRYKEPT